ncbi:MAG: tetratricopeptide repeat protein [Flavobacteriales bacterium]|jgi:tetratricopeptide (TPR) repeat protein|nr:tetratricopeptide repeat protein [Flavobacteriales bacterium]
MAKDEEVIVDVEQVYSSTESWVIENQKSLSIIVGAIVLLLGSYFAFNNFVLAPDEAEAKEYIWQAQQAFANDSFNLAINGNENTVGFQYIIDNYGMTESANLSHYYIGISHLHLGNFEDAISYLNDYDCKDVAVCAVSIGATGDAHLEIGETEKAVDYYLSAVDHSENELTAPIYLMKAGRAYEILGNYNEALSVYNRIKNDFSKSQEAQSIDKFIARAEGMAGA